MSTVNLAGRQMQEIPAARAVRLVATIDAVNALRHEHGLHVPATCDFDEDNHDDLSVTVALPIGHDGPWRSALRSATHLHVTPAAGNAVRVQLTEAA